VFSYGVVEAALTESYRIPRKALGAFRGRLTALQKQGLLGADNMPGKGIALPYSVDVFSRLIFACEMLEFGISPAAVLSMIKAWWEPRLKKIFRDALEVLDKRRDDAGPDDVILHIGGVHLMVDGWMNAVPNVNSCRLHKLANHMAMWMSMKPDDPTGLPSRAIVTNLSMRWRTFHDELSRSYMDELRAEGRAARGASRRRKRKGK
jgi:hypothetical protein